MDITFIITDQKSHYEGVIRPFLGFIKILREKYQVSFLLLNCSNELFDYLKNANIHVNSFHNKKDLIKEIINIKPKFVFVDDDLERLKLAQEIKETSNTKVITYVQILYGSHAIANCFDLSYLTFKKKLVFKLIKYIPFSFLRYKYGKILRNCDIVIANSKITATFLHALYNVEVNDIVYPSVDSEVFKPRVDKNLKEFTVYLGSHLGDVPQSLVKKILESTLGQGYIVNLFGNSKIGKSFDNPAHSIFYHSNLSDLELAKIYSKSNLTVCPQKWEQFGLVAVESAFCGTPVLCFNCMGFQETINAKTGWLANNEDDFMRILHLALKSDNQLSVESRRDVENTFSIHASGKSLDILLEKYINSS